MTEKEIENFKNNREVCKIYENRLEGELNRICVTDDLLELDGLIYYAVNSLMRMYKCRRDYLVSEIKKNK